MILYPLLMALIVMSAWAFSLEGPVLFVLLLILSVQCYHMGYKRGRR